MPEGIDVDGGGIDMFPDETKTAINALKAAIQTVGTTFETNLGTIAGLDSQLGGGGAFRGGTLGAVAYMQYQPAVDAIVPQVRTLITQSVSYGDDGLRCVDKYVNQDKTNKGIIQGAQPPSSAPS